MAVVAAVLIAAVMHFLVIRSRLGAVLRRVGGNARSIARACWNLTLLKASAYGLAGLFGVLAGMALIGLTTSADANIALR